MDLDGLAVFWRNSRLNNQPILTPGQPRNGNVHFLTEAISAVLKWQDDIILGDYNK